MSEQGEKWVATDWDGYGFRQLRAPGGVRYRPQRQEPNMESLARVLNAYEAELEQLRPRAALAMGWADTVREYRRRHPDEPVTEADAWLADYDALPPSQGEGA